MNMEKLGRAWDKNPVPKRVSLSKKLGFEGKIGSKSWQDLSPEHQQALLAHFVIATKPVMTKSGHHNVVKPRVIRPRNYVMWVGTKFYPTYHEFVTEARQLGCCKRIGRLLKGIVPGKTKVFVAHDEGIAGRGFIFGYFTLSRIDLIVDGKGRPPVVDSRLTEVRTEVVRTEKYRRGGWRELGGMYLVGTLTVLDNFVKFKQKHFRGAMKVNRDEILNSEEYIIAPSDKYDKPKKEPKWTPEDDQRLLGFMAKSKPPAQQALTKFALKSGHSRTSTVYRYNKLKGG